MEELRNFQTWTAEYLERFIEYLPTLIGALLFMIIGWWAIIDSWIIKEAVRKKKLRYSSSGIPPNDPELGPQDSSRDHRYRAARY